MMALLLAAMAPFATEKPFPFYELGIAQPGGSSSNTVIFQGVRVTALSSTLVRIEPKGPLGFCDHSTMLVVNRSAFGAGVPLRTKATNTTAAVLETDFYTVTLSIDSVGTNGTVRVGATVGNGSQALWATPDVTQTRAALRWPDPAQSETYAIKDFPRFFVPPWGPTPIPSAARAGVEPALLPTNGYDWRNNVDGDTFVFLGLRSPAGWAAGRQEFIALAGPSPVLPDWAFGVWYTWWHPYNESFAKAEISNWTTHKLPLDVRCD